MVTGFLGMCGTRRHECHRVRHRWEGDVLVQAYLGYLAVVTLANVNCPIHVASVVLNLMAIYALGVGAWPTRWF
jgi:hypothetical protein